MRYMGVDYGTKRVGISLSNESGLMAFPYSVLPNTKNLVSDLSDLIKKEKVDVIVFGKSHTLGGDDNAISEEVRACARSIGAIHNISVGFESEVFTTQEAIREQGRNSLTDASAATIILNSYLTRIKNTS